MGVGKRRQIGAVGAPQPLVVFPAASLSATSTVTIRYALTNEQTGAAGAFGLGDVDYGTGNGVAPVLTHIDEATAGGGTQITYEADLRLKGVLRVVEPLMAGTIRTMGERALAGLRLALTKPT